MSYSKFLGILLVGLALGSCKRDREFNHYGWTKGADAGFPPAARSQMLTDLLIKHKLAGMHYASVLNLLGEPDQTDSTGLSYKIEIDYGIDIDPVYSKDLLLYMNEDSIITGYKIEEQDLSPDR